ncbi:type IV pilus modification protein PilV [Pseudoduganella namucuonensis]|uniref:Type IV pilus assembly protein PilV n=1 Tax=Pseudoduganella namucuonensis TaxID=1035707 RepID=A0A1I7KVM4_9BURK|nr:type IV pilus modification protein PilV [Pseudoduganella namucuonensis]SFV01562.1 type IV pilus assembly protein PilV [Pseudoduganella namucuonensis]
MRPRLATGFTLFEVLVALLVLALGVLGAAAMQLTAMRVRQESVLMSAAMQLASGMADRMRANDGQIGAVYLTLDYDAHADPVPSAPPLCWNGGCDSAAVARADLYELKQQVAAQFPSGRARICRDAGMWSAGRLRWACSGGAGAPVVVKIGWRGKNPDGTPGKDDAGEYAPGVALALAGVGP